MCGRYASAAATLWLTTLVSVGQGEPPESLLEAAATATQGPETVPLPIRVVDEAGQPVAGAKVIPWALRSSQGHGLWPTGHKSSLVDPKTVTTDAEGKATVVYPRYSNLSEKVSTIGVSVNVDHPEYAVANDLHVEVPLEGKAFYEVPLSVGARLTIRPLIDGKPTDLANIHLLWSDTRSWEVTPLEPLPGGMLRIPPLQPGKNSLLVIKLDGERATHFSKLTDLELAAGEVKELDLPLQPGARIEGRLSDVVPRPVRAGRVKLGTLSPAADDYDRVEWSTWAPIDADGNFVVDGWPAEEAIQLIALCQGFAAASGSAPSEVANPPAPGKDGYNRPQVFRPQPGERIEVEMAPLSRCVVTTLDEDEHPVAGATVASWPNVGWWNGGSQIYCHPLVRYEKLLHGRDYQAAADDAFSTPFQGATDAQGKVTLELLPGKEQLSVFSEVYELPVFLGRRDVRIDLSPGATIEETLRLQPSGTEKLGEWDKLAGVVFGCSTREGRRICALPQVSKKMDEFATRFRVAKNRRDPQLLAEAYTVVADAFTGVGDQAEADKWRKKADEQAAIAKSRPAGTTQ